jgi:hypothetical protein
MFEVFFCWLQNSEVVLFVLNFFFKTLRKTISYCVIFVKKSKIEPVAFGYLANSSFLMFFVMS